MSQDVFITVQPFTGDQVNVSMDTTIDPPVLSVNSKVGHILLEKSDINLGKVENLSILETSGYLQSGIQNLNNNFYQSGIDLKSRLDNAVFITGNQQINGEKYFNNLKIIDYLIGNNIFAIDFQTGIYQHSLYLEKIIESNSVLDFRYPPEGNFQSVFVLLRALPNNPVQVGYENIIWRNDPPKPIIEIDDPALFFTYKAEDASPFGTQTYGINLSQPSSLYNTVILSGDQSITGIKNFINIPTVNGNNILSENSATITNLISDLSSLTLTGQSLQQQIDSLDLNYASDLQLSQTGSTLQLKIDNLSGYSNGTFSTILNLALTGQSLQNQIDNLDNTYATDTALTQTGQSINQKIDTFSGAYQNFVNNLDSNYASQVEFDTLSGNLNSSGQNLDDKINSLSGAAVLTYGTQIINGLKVFRDTVYIKDLYVTGTETIVNTTNTNVGSNYILLNATGGAIDAGIFIVTGNGLTGISNTGAIIGYDVPSNRWVFGNASRDSDLSQLEKIAGITDITNYSGFVNSNFYPSNNPSGFITGVDLSLYLTGVDLSPYVTKSGGQFIDRPTLNGTGFLLSGEAASLPETIVYTSGNQTISGLKDFTVRPTVNGTGVLLSGEAAGTANFRYSPVSGVYNLLANNRYSFDTYSGLVTGILPANPQKGDEVELYDSAGAWHLNPLIVDNNGNYIEQKKEMLECNVRHGLIKLIYTTQNNIGWRIYPMPIHNIPLFLPPSIAITGASFSGIIPFNLALTGISLLDPAQAPVDDWYWNLNTGDGYAVSGQTIAYTYLQTGLYDVTLSGSNAAGFDVEHQFINVFLPYVPTVSVTSSKLSGLAPFTGQLSATNTTQPAEYSPVDDWYWDFDNDQAFDFTGQNATVIYGQTGTYTPTAYGVNLGGTGSGFITINVIERLVPIPAIATYTASGYAPLTIQFSGVNLQTPVEFSPVDHWYWNLSGDSAPEFDQRVISYTFNETGTYTFYLTAANSAGSGVASGIVTVLELQSGISGFDPYSDYVTLLLHFNP